MKRPFLSTVLFLSSLLLPVFGQLDTSSLGKPEKVEYQRQFKERMKVVTYPASEYAKTSFVFDEQKHFVLTEQRIVVYHQQDGSGGWEPIIVDTLIETKWPEKIAFKEREVALDPPRVDTVYDADDPNIIVLVDTVKTDSIKANYIFTVKDKKDVKAIAAWLKDLAKANPHYHLTLHDPYMFEGPKVKGGLLEFEKLYEKMKSEDLLQNHIAADLDAVKKPWLPSFHFIIVFED